MEIKGVDLSIYQKGIDYKKLAKDGVKFAILRAGISEATDTELEIHIKGCLSAGIDYGFYWYSYAKSPSAAAHEAEICLKAISKFPAPNYPVFFDGEVNSIAVSVGKKVMTDIALAFVETIEKGGYPAGIYANPDWMENKYEKARLIGKVDIWLAHWTYNPAVNSKYNYRQPMWQWGLLCYDGIDTDADLCFIDYPARTAEWYSKHVVGPAETLHKTVKELAIEVIGGLWDNGEARKQLLTDAGYDYSAVQQEVNRLLAEEKNASIKSIDDLAVEVIRGLWGYGEDRKQRLISAGYDYSAVQRRVNELI